MAMPAEESPGELVPTEVGRRIVSLRGHHVLLDADLARLYGASAKHLRQQVRRNKARFPDDFCFRLTRKELMEVASIRGDLHNLRFASRLPLAFTEHGAIMAASVLHTERAAEMSVFVVRAFVRMRWMLAAHAELAVKLAELERRVGAHDRTLQELVTAIRRMLEPVTPDPVERIGFVPP